jgi:hypothetical protein
MHSNISHQLRLLSAHGIVEVLDTTGHKSAIVSSLYVKIASIASSREAGHSWMSILLRLAREMLKGGSASAQNQAAAVTMSAGGAREAAPAPPTFGRTKQGGVRSGGDDVSAMRISEKDRHRVFSSSQNGHGIHHEHLHQRQYQPSMHGPEGSIADSSAIMTPRGDEAYAPQSEGGAVGILMTRRERRESSKIGALMNAFVGVFPSVAKLYGATVDPDPISYSQNTDTINAIEAISQLLQRALIEDTSYMTPNYVPCALCSLVALEMALKEYMRIVQTSCITSKNLHAIGTQQHGEIRRMGTCIGEVVSFNMLALVDSVDIALNRIATHYKDVIPTFTFPAIYAASIRSRLEHV